MKYYSSLIRKEILHATTWVNLEDITLSERSQSKKGQVVYDSAYMRSTDESNS